MAPDKDIHASGTVRCQRIDHVYLFELLDLPNHWSSQVPNLSNLVARKREQKARCAPPCPGWTQRSRRSQLRLCVRDRCRAVIVACCMSRNSSHVHHAVGSRLADWQLLTVAVDSILLDGRAGCAACDCSLACGVRLHSVFCFRSDANPDATNHGRVGAVAIYLFCSFQVSPRGLTTSAE
jgi:hypothetical protein